VAEGFGEGGECAAAVGAGRVLLGVFVQEAGASVLDGAVLGEDFAEGFHDGVGSRDAVRSDGQCGCGVVRGGRAGGVCWIAGEWCLEGCFGGGFVVGVVEELVGSFSSPSSCGLAPECPASEATTWRSLRVRACGPP
jgi:hypothetical protein